MSKQLQQNRAVMQVAVVLSFYLAFLLVQGAQGRAVDGGTCEPGAFMCLSGGECVDGDKQCDGTPDCADATDEYNCTNGDTVTEASPNCTEESFFCKDDDTMCVAQDRRCDGTPDCKDASDEHDCAGMCEGPGNFLCHDAVCLKSSVLCNGHPDCADGSDESNCTAMETTTTPPDMCTKDEHRCPDGTCMSKNRLCDGNEDCHDGSDEQIGCATTQSSSEQASSVEVEVLIESVDSVSERVAYKKGNCSHKEFQCLDGTCIPMHMRCDKNNDCPDGSDELQGCTRPLSCWDGFMCGNGHCLPTEWECDGNKDCIDGSDEEFCSPSRIRKATVTEEERERIKNLRLERYLLMEIHNLQIQGLKVKQNMAKEELAAAKKASKLADALAEEQLHTAALERQAAEDKLRQQSELYQLKLEAVRSEHVTISSVPTPVENISQNTTLSD